MEFQFRANVAKLTNVDSAVFIHNIMFWIKKNKSNDKHKYDDRYWTYNTIRAFKEIFEFWTEQSIRTIIKNLEKKNILIIGNYNKLGFDRTKWYSIDNDFIEKFYPDYNINIEKSKLELLKPEIKQEIKPKEEEKIFYAEFVSLTKTEYKKLIEVYGEEKTKKMIEHLDNYKGSNGKKYISDYRTILAWVVEAISSKGVKGVKGVNKKTDNKPVQATNYEQRSYNDINLEDLYDNQRYNQKYNQKK